MSHHDSKSPLRFGCGRVVAAAVALIILLIVIAVLLGPRVIATMEQALERNASFERLAAATSLNDLEDAVGHLGVVLKIVDGGWIAIRYRDSHAFSGYSIAVALTSDGQWFESEAHYCGLFSIYRHFSEQHQEAVRQDDQMMIAYVKTEFDGNKDLLRLKWIETAGTLPEAIKELEAMGFACSTESRNAAMAQVR